MKQRIYTGKELALSFSENILTFNGETLTFYQKGLTHFDANAFTFDDAEMGEASIQMDILVDPTIEPLFDRFWYVDFRGERFYLSTLTPACVKDTSSLQYKYSLIFKSQRADLERYEFANFVAVESTQQPISYDFTLPLPVSDPISGNGFVERMNINLDYYFGIGVWQMILDSTYMDNLNTAIYDGTSTLTVSFSRQSLWALLTSVYETFGLRWVIRSEGGVMTIRIGSTPVSLEHTFEYGKDNGLVSIERVNPNSQVYTRLSGTGSTKNIPYRYFDTLTTEFIEDPDHNIYTENIPYTNIMTASYRQYVKGWNDAAGANAADSSTYAYLKGYNDSSTGGNFNPVDYVISESAEEIYGVRKGSVQANEEIYPTLQGITDPSLGRIDQIVAVEAVLNDDYQSTDSSISSVLTEAVVFQKYQTPQASAFFDISTGSFTIPEGSGKISFNISLDVTLQPTWKFRFGYDVFLKKEGLVIRQDEFYVDLHSTDITTLYSYEDLDPGVYTLEVSGAYYFQVAYAVHIYTLSISSIISSPNNTYKETFDVWVKNIWDTEIETEEAAEDYMHRIWDPLVSPSGDMTLMFSSGLMAGSDYTFRVAKTPGTDNYYIYHDTTKSLGGVDSHWRLSLIKSDANVELPHGLMLPNITINASAGDYFFLTNIEMPYEPYVYDAEARVEEFLNNELLKVNNENLTYTIKPSPIFLETYAENASIGVGISIPIQDAKIIGVFPANLIITNLSITYKSDSLLPEWNVTVAEKPTAAKNSIQILQGDVKVLSSNLLSAQQLTEQVQVALDGRYLRKDGQPQDSLSKTTFKDTVETGGVIKSSGYLQGQIGGSGYSIFKDANGDYVLEIDSLNVRKNLNVNSLVINQITALGGKQIYSAAAMEVSRVDSSNASYDVCYLDIKNGTVLNQFIAGDHAYCQRFDPLDNSELKYYWREVLAVGVDYINISKTGGHGTDTPEIGDVIAQLGHNSNKARQSCLIIDQTNGGSVTQYAGISGYTFAEKDYIAYGVNPSTGRAYERIYGDMYIGGRNQAVDDYLSFDSSTGIIGFRGIIRQDSTVIDDGGNTSNITVDRGQWLSSTQYYVGNTVQNGGSTYYCHTQPPVGTPTSNTTYWRPWANQGLPGTDAKVITLSASSQTIKQTELNDRTPASITVTGIIQNTTIDVWSYSVNGGSFSQMPPSGVSMTGDIVTISSASVTFNTLSIKATDGYVSDTLTISRIVDGESTYNITQSNESVTLVCDSNGVPVSGQLALATTEFNMYRGATPLSFGVVWGITSIAASTGIAAAYSDNVVSVTAIDAGIFSGYIDVAISSDWTASVVKRFKISKSIAGTDGTSVKIIGTKATPSSLPTPHTGDIGDGYITEDTGHLWVWNGSSWVDVGQIKGEDGVNGTDGINGGNSAIIYLYRRFPTQPTLGFTNAVTYTFASKAITSGSTGAWSQTIPDGTDPIWVVTAIAYSNTATDTIAYTEWSTQTVLAYNGINSRVVNLTASQLGVAYDTNSSNPNPASIVVTATALNTEGTVYYQFYKNGVSVQNTNTNTYNYIPPALYDDMPDQIEVHIREGGSTGAILARDQITIIGIRAGSDALNAEISNESHSFPSSASGVVSDYSYSGTTLKVYEGSSALVYDGIGAANGTWKVVTTGTNITPGTLADSGSFCTVGNASSMLTSSPKGYVTYLITGKTSAGVAFTITKIQSFTKSPVGATGKGVASTSVSYQSSSSGTTIPTGTWLSYIPSVLPSLYLWTRTIWTYTDDTEVTGYSVGLMGDTGASAISIACQDQNISIQPSGDVFTKAIKLKLLSGVIPIPVTAWTSKSKTLTGLTATSDTTTTTEWIINLSGFASATTTIGYVLASITYGGNTYQLSISIARVFNPIQVAKGDHVAGQTYTGNCIQRDVVSYLGDYYAVKPTVGTTSNTWVLAEWEPLNSFKNVATDTLLAANANLAGFIYKDEQMISQSGTINGNASTNWSHADFVPNLTLDGSTGEVEAMKAIIHGTIITEDGSIGGFSIDPDGVKSGNPENWNVSTYSGDYVQISPGIVRMQQSDSYGGTVISRTKVGLGKNSDPNVSENYTAGYVYRRSIATNDSKAYKPAFKIISDNVQNRDVALYIEGAVPIFGGLLPSAHFMDGDAVTVIDFSFGNNVIISNTTYRYIYLPTRQNMAYVMNTAGSFAIEVKILGQYTNTQNFLIAFQTNETTLYFRNYNGDQYATEIAMGSGDILSLMLIYDGTNYYAQRMYSNA